MPSPFPGMDPYLEQSDWVSVYVHFSVEIARYLVPLIAPKYFARAEKVYLLTTEEDRVVARRRPDVAVTSTGDRPSGPTAAVGVLESPLVVDVMIPEPEPQMTVEIFDAESKALVTAIKVLSQTNKEGTGRIEYLAKRGQLLQSDTQLIELDFLRAGRRMPMAGPMPSCPYSAVLSRSDRRPAAEVWPIPLREPLPVIPVPLLSGDADIPLNLQFVLNTMYDSFRFDLNVNYARPLEPPLNKDDDQWCRDCVQRWRSARR